MTPAPSRSSRNRHAELRADIVSNGLCLHGVPFAIWDTIPGTARVEPGAAWKEIRNRAGYTVTAYLARQDLGELAVVL